MLPHRPPTGAGEQPLVLLVDDYEDSRTMYASYLSLCGFRVAEAENGLQAVQQAQELLPDLILMDLSLPGVDGWEACRRLKKDPRTSHIPVVMLTAHSLLPDQIEASCDGVITKPCAPHALLLHISRYLGGPEETTSAAK